MLSTLAVDGGGEGGAPSAARSGEAALRLSEERLRLAQEAVDAGTWDWNLVTGESSCSARDLELLGLPPDGGAPDHAAWLAQIHPDDRAGVEDVYRRALAAEDRFSTEYRTARPEGGWRWVASHGRIVRDGSGRPVRVVGFAFDVTERRLAEERLRASEALARAQLAELEALYDMAPIGLGLFDEQLRCVRINRRLAEINGHPVEAHVGRVIWDLVPDLRDAAEPLLRRVLATGRAVTDIEFEGETAAAPGIRRDWVEQFYPLRDAGGRVRAVGVICQEITEQKRAARAMREGEERFRQIAETVEDVVWIAEPASRRFVYVNPAYERIWGRSREPLGRDLEAWFAAVHPEDRERVRAGFLGGVLDQGFDAEYRVVRPDGQVRWIRDRGRPVLASGLPPTRAAGVAVDITERKTAEEQRELLLRELNHRVKNVLTVVQAIARQTATGVDSVSGFVDGFGGRLAALSAAHELLTATGWRGARLADLVRRALAPQFPRGSEQLSLDLPEATVGPALAQNLTLALHELATNALKHGALSVPQGRVALTARLEGGELRLVWAEDGGPEIRAAPTRRGFGTSLLGQLVGPRPRGNLALDWRREGLVCTMRLALGQPTRAA